MSRVKQLAEKVIISVLKRRDVPESQWSEKVKKTGSWLFIASIVLVVPLLVLDNIPAVLVIVLQLGYAILMCLGLLLTSSNSQQERR